MQSPQHLPHPDPQQSYADQAHARAKQWAEYQASLRSHAHATGYAQGPPQLQAGYPFSAMYSAPDDYLTHAHSHSRFRSDSSDGKGMLAAGPASMEAIRPGSPLTWSPGSATDTSAGGAGGAAGPHTPYTGPSLYPSSTCGNEVDQPPRSPLRSQQQQHEGTHSAAASQPSTPVHDAIDPAVFSGTPRSPNLAANPGHDIDAEATLSPGRQQKRGAIPFPPSSPALQARTATTSTESPLRVIIRSNSTRSASSSQHQQQQSKEPLATPALTFSPACDEDFATMSPAAPDQQQQVPMSVPSSPAQIVSPASPNFAALGTSSTLHAPQRPPLLSAASDTAATLHLRPQTAFVPTSAPPVEGLGFPNLPTIRARQTSMPAMPSVAGQPISEAQARYLQHQHQAQQAYHEHSSVMYPQYGQNAYYWGGGSGQQAIGWSTPAHVRVWSSSSSSADAASPVPIDGPSEHLPAMPQSTVQYTPHGRQNSNNSSLSGGEQPHQQQIMNYQRLTPTYPNFAHPALVRSVSASSAASFSSSAGAYESARSTPASARSISPYSPALPASAGFVGLGISGFDQTSGRPPLSAPPTVHGAPQDWYAVHSGTGATEWHWSGPYSPGYPAEMPVSAGAGAEQLAHLQLGDSAGSRAMSDTEQHIGAQSTIRARRNTRSAPYPRPGLKRATRTVGSGDKLPAMGAVSRGKVAPSPSALSDIDVPLHMLPTKKSRGRRPVESKELDVDPEAEATTASTQDQLAFSGVTRTGKPKKIFICRVPGCDKCFRRGEHLKRHIKSLHTHDKPWQCDHPGCFKVFTRGDNLQQHKKNIHGTYIVTLRPKKAKVEGEDEADAPSKPKPKPVSRPRRATATGRGKKRAVKKDSDSEDNMSDYDFGDPAMDESDASVAMRPAKAEVAEEDPAIPPIPLPSQQPEVRMALA